MCTQAAWLTPLIDAEGETVGVLMLVVVVVLQPATSMAPPAPTIPAVSKTRLARTFPLKTLLTDFLVMGHAYPGTRAMASPGTGDVRAGRPALWASHSRADPRVRPPACGRQRAANGTDAPWAWLLWGGGPRLWNPPMAGQSRIPQSWNPRPGPDHTSRSSH